MLSVVDFVMFRNEQRRNDVMYSACEWKKVILQNPHDLKLVECR